MAFNIYMVRNKKQYYRIITSSFIHGSYAHLFFNMFSFYSFAKHMELAYSPYVIGICFFLSTIGGSIFSLIKNRKNPKYTAIGASGGVCGIIYASIFLMESGNIYLMFIPFPISDKVYAVGFLIVSYVLMKRNKDNIGHDAHIGGAMTGVVYAIITIPLIIKYEYKLLLAMCLPLAGIYLFDRFVWKYMR
ncbi:rhomboid family intramembrane serine protease [Spirochaetota bacterium]